MIKGIISLAAISVIILLFYVIVFKDIFKEIPKLINKIKNNKN